MATDVARLSFDAARRYTGVVPQQGRVSLEAEQNEQRVIDAEERRKELLDIVGVAGTPDDGYAVFSSGGELTIAGGTMYVGGLRLKLDDDLSVDSQPDWLDGPERGRWHEGRSQHVMLMVEERDVTAVEDPMLYEPALGGPDGSARTRLLQRIETLASRATTCDAALRGDRKIWETEGLAYDPATAQLLSQSRLLVTWEAPSEPPSPCEPTTIGGYLGAENQLIRVQITDFDDDAGTVSLLWGYDDASMLYRVNPDASTNPVLTLERSPVDDYHRPRAGQAVQVLRSAAKLQSTDGVVEGYVAALDGEVAVLSAPYDPDTKTVPFPAALPTEYSDATLTPQLYLRVWEQLLSGVSLGAPLSLTGTGLQITISLADGDSVHVGDYWCIAVRPSTSTTVYPDRLLREAQPPDGPRLWACPLAVVEWKKEELVVLDDCRHHFPHLIDQQDDCCCTVELSPSDAPRIQEILDRVAAYRATPSHAQKSQQAQPGKITVCFRPGRYTLRDPLVLRREHSGITLSACAEGVIIEALTRRGNRFGYGLIILAEAREVTISGIDFDLPQVVAARVRVGATTGSGFKRSYASAINDEVSRRSVSVAIRSINAANIEVSDCTFHFNIGERRLTVEESADRPRNVFGVGVFASGSGRGHRLLRNQFVHAGFEPIDDEGIRRMLVGYLIAPVATPRAASDEPKISNLAYEPKVSDQSEIDADKETNLETEKDEGERLSSRATAVGASLMPALLDEAEFAGNTFDGITVPVIAVASLGRVRVVDNAVANCYGGFWLFDASAFAKTDMFGAYNVKTGTEDISAARRLLAGGLIDPVLVAILLVAETFPLPPLADFEAEGISDFDLDKIKARAAAAETARREGMTVLIDRISEEAATRTEEPQTEPQTDRQTETQAARASARASRAMREKKMADETTFNPRPTEDIEAELPTLEDASGRAFAGLNEVHLLEPFKHALQPAVWVTGNDISCSAVTAKGTSGAGLYVFVLDFADDERSISSAIVANNRIVAKRSLVAAAVVGVMTCSVTGNVLVDARSEMSVALGVLLVLAPAITGNVVVGRAALPHNRPFPAPMDTWLPLNTVRI